MKEFGGEGEPSGGSMDTQRASLPGKAFSRRRSVTLWFYCGAANEMKHWRGNFHNSCSLISKFHYQIKSRNSLIN